MGEVTSELAPGPVAAVHTSPVAVVVADLAPVEQTKECPFCGEAVRSAAKKCKHCGETIDVALRAAEEAKREVADAKRAATRAAERPMVFMNAGGAAASASSGTRTVYATTYSNGMAYLLWLGCLFCGICGLHRFYVGKPLTGLLWIFTFGLLGFGQMLDLLLIPGMVGTANRRVRHGN